MGSEGEADGHVHRFGEYDPVPGDCSRAMARPLPAACHGVVAWAEAPACGACAAQDLDNRMLPFLDGLEGLGFSTAQVKAMVMRVSHILLYGVAKLNVRRRGGCPGARPCCLLLPHAHRACQRRACARAVVPAFWGPCAHVPRLAWRRRNLLPPLTAAPQCLHS